MRLIILLCLLASGAAASATLTLSQKGSLVTKFERADLAKKAPPVSIEVWEPHEKKKVTYKGFPMDALLSAAYGDAWKKQEEILFTCSDGYQPSIPVSRFLQEKAFLVFERGGDPSFELTNTLQGDEKVKLGPYYLVWNNAGDPDREAKGATGWPYQVEKIDLIRFGDRFPRMAPPTGSSARTVRGFVAFRNHCANCHSINGDGGLKGIELNFPVSVTEYFKTKWLKQWMIDPSKMRLKTSMPALHASGPARLAIADDITTYLEVMAKNKQPPPPEVTK